MGSVYIILLLVSCTVARQWPSDLTLPVSHSIRNCGNVLPFSDNWNDGTIYTQLMPYTDIGVSGFVYGFQFCSSVADEEVRVEIWGQEGCASCYRLVGHRTVSSTVVGINYAYFERPVEVFYSDVLGISYQGINPIRYSTFSGCSASADHMIRYDGYIDSNQIVEFQYDPEDFQCRRYAMQVFLETIDLSNNCEIHQAVEERVPYSLYSHDDFPEHDYPNDYERCWKIRAAEPGHGIVFDSVAFDVEFHRFCSFDELRFYATYPSEFCYHDNCLGFCGPDDSDPDEMNEQWIILQNRVKLVFSTDNINTGRGFYLQYRSVDPDEYPTIASPDYEIIWNTDQESTTTELVTPVGVESTGESRFWKDWEDWKKAVAVIAIIIGVALLVVLIVMLIFYCCNRDEQATTPKSKVAVQETHTYLPYEKTKRPKTPRFNNVYTSEPSYDDQKLQKYNDYLIAYEYSHDRNSYASSQDGSGSARNDVHIWTTDFKQNGIQSSGYGSNRSRPLSRSSSVTTKTTLMSAPKPLKASDSAFGRIEID